MQIIERQQGINLDKPYLVLHDIQDELLRLYQPQKELDALESILLAYLPSLTSKQHIIPPPVAA